MTHKIGFIRQLPRFGGRFRGTGTGHSASACFTPEIRCLPRRYYNTYGITILIFNILINYDYTSSSFTLYGSRRTRARGFDEFFHPPPNLGGVPAVNPRRVCLRSLKATAAVVFSYCQVYKYRRFRTVRQNTSRAPEGGGTPGWGGGS